MNVLRQDVKIILLLLQFLLKIQSFEKSVVFKSAGEQPKLTNYKIWFLLFGVIVKIFHENCQI